MFFNSYALGSLRSFMLKTERQTIQTEKLTEKMQDWNQILANSRLACKVLPNVLLDFNKNEKTALDLFLHTA